MTSTPAATGEMGPLDQLGAPGVPVHAGQRPSHWQCCSHHDNAMGSCHSSNPGQSPAIAAFFLKTERVSSESPLRNEASTGF